jgi:hypothetical protein
MDQELKTFISTHLDYLDRLKNGLSSQDADVIAAQFLRAVARLSAYRLEVLSKEYSACSSVYSVTRHKAWDEAQSSTAKAKEIEAEANSELLRAREAEETAEHNLRYINSLIDVFNNAHVQFRQISSKINNGY